MIIETIVTSVAADGRVNCAPMGPEWGEDVLILKPFKGTTTLENLVATGEAVVNLTDDVMAFALGAISSPDLPTVPAEVVKGHVLEAACSWREVRVREAQIDGPRASFVCDVVHRGFRREFLGFNRARHAVLEAAILATRTKYLPTDEIMAELRRLQVPVDKTAGPREREAMQLLTDYVQRQAASLERAAS